MRTLSVTRRIEAPRRGDLRPSLRLRENGGATEVEWSTEYRVPSFLGGLQERVWAIALRRGFGRILADIDRTLTAG